MIENSAKTTSRFSPVSYRTPQTLPQIKFYELFAPANFLIHGIPEVLGGFFFIWPFCIKYALLKLNSKNILLHATFLLETALGS